MEEGKLALIIDKLRGYTDYLYFHLMGEPLLHPQLPRFLELAGARGFKVILTTNGTLLEERTEEILKQPALHKVNISLHSLEANTPEGQENYVEKCLKYSRRAQDAGVITTFRLWNLDGEETRGQNGLNREILRTIEKYYPRPWEEGQRGIKLSEKVFLNFGEKFVWPSLSERDYGEHCFCYGLKDQIGIHVDGTVVPCCLDHEGDIRLGNILTETMEEILSSRRVLDMINGFQKRIAKEELCKKCGYARRFKI